MTDDWSLKGKEIELEFNLRLLGETKTNNLQIATLYKKEIVETLRKKLIEDIDNTNFRITTKSLSGTTMWHDDSNKLRPLLKEIINNRFGVE